MLRAAGCEVVQGYLFGKPAPLRVIGGQTHSVEQIVQERRGSAGMH